MIDLAVIPVAGRGTSLLPLTKSQPKEMLPIGRKPVVQYVVEELIQCGVHRLLFITGSGKTAIENHFDVNEDLIAFLRMNGKEESLAELAFERKDAQYFYTRQRRLTGLGNAVLCAESFVKEQPFVVALGDTILGLDRHSKITEKMIARFEKESPEVSAIVAFDEVPLEEVVHYGIAKPKSDGFPWFELEDLVEKPTRENAPSRRAVAARYVFSPEIFACLRKTEPDLEGTIQLTDAIRILIRQGKKVLGLCLSPEDSRYDIGSFDSYYTAFLDAVLRDPELGPRFQERFQERFR